MIDKTKFSIPENEDEAQAFIAAVKRADPEQRRFFIITEPAGAPKSVPDLPWCLDSPTC